jgi:methylated-DNA-protein-cysteine methyltransferase-like protein
VKRNELYHRIYQTIQQVPYGKVATYGQIAKLAGFPGYARQVGYALYATPHDLEVPWHRVINAKGEISLKPTGPYDQIQRQMLEAEGVQFDEKGRVALKIYQWQPQFGDHHSILHIGDRKSTT